MAPLDWLTPERVADRLDTVGAVLFLGLGILSLYRGLTTPPTDVYLGVSALVWIGLGWVLSGLYVWFSRGYWKRASEK
ncbi:hypothetical protein [Halorussus aquaticus]|uniref:hypothetical protein n=1 Tax=Halorussus aquaticus TaxID=2953748 RepID=UPI0020B6CA31|nr:hypothetical protein [Halorussus aquaticus]